MSHKNNHKLRIGIVGAGEIVRRRHLPRCNAIPMSRSSRSAIRPTKARKILPENAPHATPMQNWAELLGMPELDIVWIGTPPYMHSAVTVSALEAGKHVFCQARMAMDLAEAEEMLTASRRFPELVTMLCPPPHGMRGDLLVQKLLAEKALGRPHHLRLQSLNSAFLDPDAPAHWRQRIEMSGLNALTLGIYVGGLAALVWRHHRRLCARANSPADAPGLRSDDSGYAHGALHFRERNGRRRSNSAASTRMPRPIGWRCTATSGR